MIKLLDKQLKAFTVYAFFVLVCSIPVYYFIVDLIWIRELDEHNHISAEMTKANLTRLKLGSKELEESLRLWNKLRPENRIEKIAYASPDRTYNLYRKNQYIPSKGYDRFQGLVTCFSLNGQTYRLTIETNVEETHETIVAITAVTMLFFAILLLGFIFLNRRISQKLWKPFYLTLKKIRHFDLNSQQPVTFDKNGIVEFEELNHHVRLMTDHSLTVYGSQKEFIENASHELQTPLAIVRSKLDLLQQDPDLTAGQSVLIESTYKAMSRIGRLNKNLLLLSKIENHQYTIQEDIELSKSIENALEMFEDPLSDKGLRLTADLDDKVKVKGNGILLEILLNNLLLNAIRHSSEGAAISIVLSQKKLMVSNSGPAPLNPDKLFNRFSVAAEQGTGSGLGLSIVKSICERHEWAVGYYFEQGAHHFSVGF